MSRRKLLVLVSPNGEAMKRDIFESCARLREHWDLSFVVAPGDRRAFEPLGAPVATWRPEGIFGMFPSIRRLRRVAESFRPQVVHAHGFGAAAVALGTFPASLAKRTVVTFHDPLRHRELPDKFVERRMSGYARRAGALVATYPLLARAVEKRFDLTPGSIAVVPHGIDTTLDRGEIARPATRPGPIVGWCGALAADRAWEVAIDALARVRGALPDARLVMAGDGRARQFVAAHARMQKVGDAVEFRREARDHELLAAVDVLAVPSSAEAQPHVLLEAIAAGVPVVAGNAGARADALRDLETAWLVDDDAEGLSAGIADAWSKIDAAWSGAMRQRLDAREPYLRERVTERVEELYERVAEHG